MSAQAETQPSHLPAAEAARWLTPASELEETELGERVADAPRPLGPHPQPRRPIDQPFEAARELDTRSRCTGPGPSPAAWWPPSAGPAPR